MQNHTLSSKRIGGRLLSLGCAAAMLSTAGLAHADFVDHDPVTFVNAVSEFDSSGNPNSGANTFRADGEDFIPASDQSSNLSDNWRTRSGFPNDGIFQGHNTDDLEDHEIPELVTHIDGLQGGATYRVYAFFWSDLRDERSWPIRAGLESNPHGNTLFHWGNEDRDYSEVSGSVVAPAASGLDFATSGLQFEDDDRTMFAADLGWVEADAEGEISVYVHDLPSTVSDNRTWYDGVGYAIPEPGSLALLGAGATLLMVRRRR